MRQSTNIRNSIALNNQHQPLAGKRLCKRMQSQVCLNYMLSAVSQKTCLKDFASVTKLWQSWSIASYILAS